VKSNDPHRNQSVITHGSPTASARYAFILLHGHGASAEDMVSLGWELTDGHTALSQHKPPSTPGTHNHPLRLLRKTHVPDNEIQRNRFSVIVNDSLKRDLYDRAYAARYNKN
jgi:predicted esterase